jgi:hypothetical protein
MAEPDRPPRQRSLFDFGVRRVAEKRPPPEVDQAEVERGPADAGGRRRGRGRGRGRAQPCAKGEVVVVDP